MSKFIDEIGKYIIVRKFEYTQFDTGYAVLNADTCEQMAWFDDCEDDEEGQDSALDAAVAWCKA